MSELQTSALQAAIEIIREIAKTIPTQLLYQELYNRDEVFGIQLWMREDVERAFPNKSEDEVEEYMAKNAQYFNDRCTELCWEVMEDLD